MRNVFCKKYPGCLRECVELHYEDFECENCLDFELDKTGISAKEFFGACVLLARLFLPKVYMEYLNEKYFDRDM